MHAEILDGMVSGSEPPYHPNMSEQWGSKEYFLENLATDRAAYNWYLYELVRRTEPKIVVELGTLLGGSCICMLQGLPATSEIYTLDLTVYPQDCLFRLEDPRLHRLCADTTNPSTPKKWVGSAHIDFLYIDTNHTYEQLSKEWGIWSPYLASRALVAFDDIHVNSGMSKFWEELQYEKVEDSNLHHSGFGAIQYVK